MSSPSASSSKPNSRFSTFKVFKFSGNPKPPAPPPKDPNYLYSSAQGSQSVLSLSGQSLSVADSFSQPPTPLSTAYQPSQYAARSPSPAPSRATQSPSSLPPDSAGFRRNFIRMASSMGKKSMTFPKPSRTNTSDSLASSSASEQQATEPTDDDSISLPWGFQHNMHVDENYQGIPNNWDTALSEAGFTDDEIIAIRQNQLRTRSRTPASDRDIDRYSPISRTQSPSQFSASSPSVYSGVTGIPPPPPTSLTTLVKPRARSSSLRRKQSSDDARSEHSSRFHHHSPPPPLPVHAPMYHRRLDSDSNASSAAGSGQGANRSIDRSYSEIDANESVATHSTDSQFVYIQRNTITLDNFNAQDEGHGKDHLGLPAPVPSAATMSSMMTVRPAAASPSPSLSTFSHAPSATAPSTSSRSAGGMPARTPPRKVFRVVNETPPPEPSSPPPAYNTSDRDGYENDGGNNRAGTSMDLPPPLNSFDRERPRPAEKQHAGTSSSRQPQLQPAREAVEPGDETILQEDQTLVEADSELLDGEDAEEGVDELGQTVDGLIKHKPPRLSVLPPRLSLRKDAIDDLSDWTASLFSSIPTASTSGNGTPPHSPLRAQAQAARSKFRNSVVKSKAGTSSGLGAGLLPAATISSSTSPSASTSTFTPSLSPVLPNITVQDSEYQEQGRDDGDEARDYEEHEHENMPGYTISTSPLYNELMGMMQSRTPGANSNYSSQYSPSNRSPRTPAVNSSPRSGLSEVGSERSLPHSPYSTRSAHLEPHQPQSHSQSPQPAPRLLSRSRSPSPLQSVAEHGSRSHSPPNPQSQSQPPQSRSPLQSRSPSPSPSLSITLSPSVSVFSPLDLPQTALTSGTSFGLTGHTPLSPAFTESPMFPTTPGSPGYSAGLGHVGRSNGRNYEHHLSVASASTVSSRGQSRERDQTRDSTTSQLTIDAARVNGHGYYGYYGSGTSPVSSTHPGGEGERGRSRDRNSRDRDSNMSSASGSTLIHASMAEVRNVSVVRMVKAKAVERPGTGDTNAETNGSGSGSENATGDGNGEESRARRTSEDSHDEGSMESGEGQAGSGSLGGHSVAMRIAEDGESSEEGWMNGVPRSPSVFSSDQGHYSMVSVMERAYPSAPVPPLPESVTSANTPTTTLAANVELDAVCPAPTAIDTSTTKRSSSRTSRSGVSSRSRSSSGSEYGFSESPRQTMSVTSGSNSAEDGNVSGVGREPKSPVALAFLGVASPQPSPLKAQFPDAEDEENSEGEEPTVSVKGVSTGKPSIVITTDMVSRTSASPSPSPSPAASSATATVTGISPAGAGALTPASSTSASSSAATSPLTPAQRYPGWLSEVVRPLSEFIDDTIDPRDLFDDLVEIAEGESGSVFSARIIVPPPPPKQTNATGKRPPRPTRALPSPGDSSPSPSSPSPTSPKASFPFSISTDVVAIKNVPISPAGSPKLVDLKRELQMMRGLRHPNVLSLDKLYVDLVEDSLWIGMELMERSLADVLGVSADAVEMNMEDGDSEVLVVGEKMVARFAWDVLLALSFLQKQHIAHRDLRSDNLLLNKDGVLKLADFSNAVQSPPGTPQSSDNVGVIYWQAPEMRTGPYDPLKVDVWSLGATAWELVTGEPPFSDVQDTRQIGDQWQLPSLPQPEIYSRPFHEFLNLCCQPVANRFEPDKLLNAHFIRTACPRSAIVQLLAQCKATEEKLLHRRRSVDSQGTISLS